MNQWDATTSLRALGRQGLVTHQGCEDSAGAANKMEAENRSDKESQLRLRSSSMCTYGWQHTNLAPSSVVSTAGSCAIFLHHLQEEDGPALGPGKRNIRVCFQGHGCVINRSLFPTVLSTEWQCKPRADAGDWVFLHVMDTYERHKIQQQAVNLLQSLVTLSDSFLSFGLMYSFSYKISYFGQCACTIIVVQFEDKFLLTNTRPKRRLTATSPFWGKKPDWTV